MSERRKKAAKGRRCGHSASVVSTKKTWLPNDMGPASCSIANVAALAMRTMGKHRFQSSCKLTWMCDPVPRLQYVGMGTSISPFFCIANNQSLPGHSSDTILSLTTTHRILRATLERETHGQSGSFICAPMRAEVMAWRFRYQDVKSRQLDFSSCRKFSDLGRLPMGRLRTVH